MINVIHEHARNALLVALGMTACLAWPACRSARPLEAASPRQHTRLVAMKSAGGQASVTVFPVGMVSSQEGRPATRRPAQDVGMVLGMLLEQAGMPHLQPADVPFASDSDIAFEEIAGAFAAHVLAYPIKTDYALYGELAGQQGNPPRIEEVRSVVVDRDGQIVWIDRQRKGDRLFDRMKPSCPMTCCMLLTEVARDKLAIPKSARSDSRDGTFARLWAQSSPVPGDDELNAMKRRQAVMKQARKDATLSVLPVRHFNDKTSHADASELAALTADRKLCRPIVVTKPFDVTIQGARNQQNVLWSLARAFKSHIKENPPDADYVLLADYMMDESGKAHAVHFVVCDRTGEWVIVDFQNDHHEDFKRIKPDSAQACSRLVAKRLETYLK